MNIAPGSSPKTILKIVQKALGALARPHRAGTVDGYSLSSMEVLGVIVPDLRIIVRGLSEALKGHDPKELIALATLLVHEGSLEARQVGYELIGRRPDVRALLSTRAVESLGKGNDSWKAVDIFGCEVAGPCWREGRVTDAALERWARSKDRWWRRTALVATIPLNMKSRGGQGDAGRTLHLCGLCAADRDEMVVKANSWALRELSKRGAAPVREFLAQHAETLSPRVIREVSRKLESGRKNP